jgi:SAM-dependent methyltransferase
MTGQEPPHDRSDYDVRYWVQRHQQFAGSPESTGLMGSTPRQNRTLYDLRLRALSDQTEHMALAGRTVLDAGCGLGDFARFYHSKGARVYGCDVSSIAVARCNAAQIGVFKCGRIADVPSLFPGVRFDVVHCFDVLYHITDDAAWRDALGTFAEVSAPRATWYFTEFYRQGRSASHVRRRGQRAYREALAQYGRRVTSVRPIHWLPGAAPRVFARLPGLAPPLERLCSVWPLNTLSLAVLMTVGITE